MAARTQTKTTPTQKKQRPGKRQKPGIVSALFSPRRKRNTQRPAIKQRSGGSHITINLKRRSKTRRNKRR